MKEVSCACKDEYKHYYYCHCRSCGFSGWSKYFNGGKPLADTGDYSDIRCPKCNSSDIDEDQPCPICGNSL